MASKAKRKSKRKGYSLKFVPLRGKGRIKTFEYWKDVPSSYKKVGKYRASKAAGVASSLAGRGYDVGLLKYGFSWMGKNTVWQVLRK